MIVCKPCLRKFKSDKALAQHNRDVHEKDGGLARTKESPPLLEQSCDEVEFARQSGDTLVIIEDGAVK